MRRAQTLLARMARQISDRLRAIWRRSARERGRDVAPLDSLTSYAAPPPRSREPPYASLRQ